MRDMSSREGQVLPHGRDLEPLAGIAEVKGRLM